MIRNAVTNIVGEVPFADLSANMALFDSLPLPVRRRMHQASISFAPETMQGVIDQCLSQGFPMRLAILVVIECINQTEALEFGPCQRSNIPVPESVA